MKTNRLPLALLFASLITALSSSAMAQGDSCKAVSAAVAPTVVELYTSEGCSSCPPADRWLSTLKGRADVLPLAFHVGYWDNLGWVDRFAKPEFTERQRQWSRLHRSSSVYTPQVVADGQDWRQWPSVPKPRGPAPVTVSLQRKGDQVLASVSSAASGTPALAGYWAVLEDNHISKVKAGENSGETLKHDHVVRLVQPVAEWVSGAGYKSALKVNAGEAQNPRRVVFVVVNAKTQQPLQAVSLGC